MMKKIFGGYQYRCSVFFDGDLDGDLNCFLQTIKSQIDPCIFQYGLRPNSLTRNKNIQSTPKAVTANKSVYVRTSPGILHVPIRFQKSIPWPIKTNA